MTKLLLAFCATSLMATAAQAATVDPNASATTWQSFSATDRFAYAIRASQLCQSHNCGAVEIKACMDEVTRPPLPRRVYDMTIGEVAMACIATLG